MHLYCFSFLQGKIQLDNCTVIMDFSRSKSVMEVHKDWICGKVMSLRKIANCFFFIINITGPWYCVDSQLIALFSVIQ